MKFGGQQRRPHGWTRVEQGIAGGRRVVVFLRLSGGSCDDPKFRTAGERHSRSSVFGFEGRALGHLELVLGRVLLVRAGDGGACVSEQPPPVSARDLEVVVLASLDAVPGCELWSEFGGESPGELEAERPRSSLQPTLIEHPQRASPRRHVPARRRRVQRSHRSPVTLDAIPLDVKYKLYDERNVEPSDLYQAFLYAQALSHAGPHPQVPTTVLIHPGEAFGPHRVLIRDVEGRSAARVRTMALDLRAILPALDDTAGCAELHRMIRTNLTWQ